jgi:hypothetical protein
MQKIPAAELPAETCERTIKNPCFFPAFFLSPPSAPRRRPRAKPTTPTKPANRLLLSFPLPSPRLPPSFTQAVLASLSPLARLVPATTPRRFSCRLNRARRFAGAATCASRVAPRVPFARAGVPAPARSSWNESCCGERAPVPARSGGRGLREERPPAAVHGGEAADLQGDRQAPEAATLSRCVPRSLSVHRPVYSLGIHALLACLVGFGWVAPLLGS